VIVSLLPIGVAAQATGDSLVLTPGLHNLELPRADEPAIHYAISIPRNYSPSTPVPLILALHFGVRGGDAAGMRLPPRGLALFEAVINVVHKAAPGAALAFNSLPQDSADAPPEG
jgi:hypothetical protein